MVCSCSGSSTANIWTFFYSLQSKCHQGFSLHPFLSLSNLGTETIVTATYSWVNWDNKLRIVSCNVLLSFSNIGSEKYSETIIPPMSMESKRHRHYFISPDCYKLREGKHTSQNIPGKSSKCATFRAIIFWSTFETSKPCCHIWHTCLQVYCTETSD